MNKKIIYLFLIYLISYINFGFSQVETALNLTDENYGYSVIKGIFSDNTGNIYVIGIGCGNYPNDNSFPNLIDTNNYYFVQKMTSGFEKIWIKIMKN
jgi:hypothetical protein